MEEEEAPEGEGLIRHIVVRDFSMLFGCIYCSFDDVVVVIVFFLIFFPLLDAASVVVISSISS